MAEKVSPFRVGVICNDKALLLNFVLVVHVKLLEDLDGFAARRRTHVKHCVAGLQVEQSHRNHGNFFLSEDAAVFSLIDYKSVECLQLGVFPQFRSS